MTLVGVCFVKIGDNWINISEIVRVYPGNTPGKLGGSRVELKNGNAIYSSKPPDKLIKELKEENNYTYLL